MINALSDWSWFDLSWSWTRIRHVQKRYSRLHRYWYRCSLIDMHPESELVRLTTMPPYNQYHVSDDIRFLIWIGSDQEKTFGPTVTRLICDNIEPERMILWDTKKRGGRPDTMKLLIDTWKSFEAEVIFITSNKQGNDDMMRGCYEGKRTQCILSMGYSYQLIYCSRTTRLRYSLGLLAPLFLRCRTN
jgi:hypothetical protein